MATDDNERARSEADGHLIARARRDRAAFGELYDLYVRRVYAFCLTRSTTSQEAEDLTALTFERAMSAIARYEDRGRPFSSWLLRIAANAAIDRARASKHEIRTGGDLPIEVEGKEYLDHCVEHWEQAAWLRSHLDALSPDQQRVIDLRFFEDCSLQEIAQRMERSEDAVKQLLRRALTGLRMSLRKEATGHGYE